MPVGEQYSPPYGLKGRIPTVWPPTFSTSILLDGFDADSDVYMNVSSIYLYLSKQTLPRLALLSACPKTFIWLLDI